MPGAQQRAVGEDRLEAEHGLARHPVLRAVQPARVGRDVPADRGQSRARGIRGVEDAVRGEGGGEIGGDHPGLDHRDLVEQVDLADPGEPLQAQHDRAGARGGAAGESGAGAARNDGGARLVGQAQHLLHPGGVRRQDQEEGGAVRGLHRRVAGVARRGVLDHGLLPEQGAQVRGELGEALGGAGVGEGAGEAGHGAGLQVGRAVVAAQGAPSRSISASADRHKSSLWVICGIPRGASALSASTCSAPALSVSVSSASAPPGPTSRVRTRRGPAGHRAARPRR